MSLVPVCCLFKSMTRPDQGCLGEIRCYELHIEWQAVFCESPRQGKCRIA